MAPALHACSHELYLNCICLWGDRASEVQRREKQIKADLHALEHRVLTQRQAVTAQLAHALACMGCTAPFTPGDPLNMLLLPVGDMCVLLACMTRLYVGCTHVDVIRRAKAQRDVGSVHSTGRGIMPVKWCFTSPIHVIDAQHHLCCLESACTVQLA